MKKTAVIVICYLLTIINCKAQPNGSFENWSYLYSVEEPDGWQTINFLHTYSSSNPLSAFKVAGIDVHSGNYALKLKTVYMSNKPPQVAVNDSTGGAFTGKVIFSPPAEKRGFPYTQRPEKLQFWAKYTPVGNDIAQTGVLLKKWNGTGYDTIAFNLMEIPATPDYTLFEITLNYFSSVQPDSALLAFVPSMNETTARVNSTLYLDDVQFVNSVGIAERPSECKTSVYPNPAMANVTIYTENEQADHVQLADLSGKVMGMYKVENNHICINTSFFPAGVYFYIICNNKKSSLAKGQFSVVK